MLELYFANMMEDVIGDKGVSLEQIEELRPKIHDAHLQISGRKWKELAFLDLRSQDVSRIKEVASMIRERYENFLFIGMGGSAMGPRAILNALSQLHNISNKTRIFIFDNADPLVLSKLLSILDLSKTAVNIVSKSGSTAETNAAFMIIWERMSRQLGREEAGRNIFLTTNSEKGISAELIKKYGFTSLQMSPDVVGRFSVLSAAGLLISEIAGINCSDMLRGAADIYERCSKEEVWENPAYILSSLLYLMSTINDRKINVLMPYADGLKSLAEWFCQLWAESLGKLGSGQTPYPSVGTKDQHSQLQLWMEGPEDKVVIFIKIKEYEKNHVVPDTFNDIGGMRYLVGKNLGDICNAGQESTEYILTKDSKPNMTIIIPTIDAYHIGQLFMFFELTTVMTGFLFGINPFNQPWVEAGKNMILDMIQSDEKRAKKCEADELRNKYICWKV